MADIEVRMDGATVDAKPGDRVVIRLPENGSTGYQWVLSEVDDGLEVESNDLSLPGTARPGAGGERVVVLQARKRGPARVSLQLKREWEPEPIERFTATVNVVG